MINMIEYDNLLSEYIQQIQFTKMSSYYIDKCLQKQFDKALNAIDQLRKELTNEQSGFFVICNQITKICFISLCCQMENQAKQKQYSEFKQNLQLLVAYMYNLKFQKNQPLHQMFILWITGIINQNFTDIEQNEKDYLNHMIEQNLKNLSFNQFYQQVTNINDENLNEEISEAIQQDTFQIIEVQDDFALAKLNTKFENFKVAFSVEIKIFEQSQKIILSHESIQKIMNDIQ
eukprot:TRINITY_DN5589_c0_g1_i2.p2 TRINITY_DN5589_c0_g1~~TRINITY_DN5589_c0_g1_i2.p2  ORF type:complete len:232 (+),score=31.48 TRINITY_DN5589_c0_g1_i2:315-1010(+)